MEIEVKRWQKYSTWKLLRQVEAMLRLQSLIRYLIYGFLFYVRDTLNIVYPEDLAIQRDNVLIQSSQVINLSEGLLKV